MSFILCVSPKCCLLVPSFFSGTNYDSVCPFVHLLQDVRVSPKFCALFPSFVVLVPSVVAGHCKAATKLKAL